MKKLLLGISLLFLVYACGNSGGSDSTSSADGEQVFKTNCVACHGADGALGINDAANLQISALTVAQRVEIITNGKAGTTMISYKPILSEGDIKAVAEYTMTLKK